MKKNILFMLVLMGLHVQLDASATSSRANRGRGKVARDDESDIVSVKSVSDTSSGNFKVQQQLTQYLEQQRQRMPSQNGDEFEPETSSVNPGVQQQLTQYLEQQRQRMPSQNNESAQILRSNAAGVYLPEIPRALTLEEIIAGLSSGQRATLEEQTRLRAISGKDPVVTLDDVESAKQAWQLQQDEEARLKQIQKDKALAHARAIAAANAEARRAQAKKIPNPVMRQQENGLVEWVKAAVIIPLTLANVGIGAAMGIVSPK